MIDKAVIVICENDEELEAFLKEAEYEGFVICERKNTPCRSLAIRIDAEDRMHICPPETYILNPYRPKEKPITLGYWQARRYTSQYYRDLETLFEVQDTSEDAFELQDAFETLFD